jgi:L-asparaginase
MKIKVLITGGTIDDLDYEREEDAPQNHESLIPELLEQARVTPEYDSEILMQKDSRVITDKDRELILEKCKASSEDRIIITHGTYTMPGTAKYLGKVGLDKTIVLFGAHIPANKPNSDALFNLGTAFIAVQLLSKGVYVLMNGKVFTWDNVRKDFPTGYFKEE